MGKLREPSATAVQKIMCLFLLMIMVGGCKTVKLLPDHDAVIAQEIDEAAKDIDAFYLTMLETTANENGERAFKRFAEGYVDIEVKLNAILTKNKLRELNENSVEISKNTVELWQRFKNRHKEDDTISDANIELNRMAMADQMFILAKSEGFKF